MFIFNTELLLIGITGVGHLFVVVVSALTGMLLFAAATQGWFLTRSKWWETIILLLVVFTLFRPGFWMDQITPPLVKVDAAQIYDIAADLPENAQLRVHVVGETLEGDPVDKVVMLPMGPVAEGQARLQESAGLELREEEGRFFVDNLTFGGPAERQKIDFDWEIADVQVKSDRAAKQWMFLPAFLLLMIVVFSQKKRKEQELV